MNKIICIVGPTASGKTGLGIFISKKYNGEIISADSRQVYKGLDIGTGKDLGEYGDIKHHLINICEAGERLTLFDYLKLARASIDDIISRGKIPIVVGGTGLYVQALMEGFELEKVKNPRRAEPSGRSQIPKYTRVELEKMSLKQLQNIYNKLPQRGPERSGGKIENSKIDLNNPHRLIRAIEKAQNGVVPTKKKPNFEALQIGIDLPRKKLYKRIDKRVDQRFEKEGMIEEVANLIDRGVDIDWLTKLGLEYRIIGIYVMSQRLGLKNLKIKKLIENWKFKIDNFQSFDSMSTLLKYKSHAFARRQLTWFRRFPEIKWVTNKKEASGAVDNYLKI